MVVDDDKDGRDPGPKLCLDVGAVLLAPSVTAARGRAAELAEAVEPVGEMTEERVALEPLIADGRAEVEEDSGARVVGAPVVGGFVGTMDARRVGAATGFVAVGLLAIPEDTLTDFLRAVAAADGGFVVDEVGLDATGFVAPAPKVPELIT